MKIKLCLLLAATLGVASADKLTLRDGKVVEGTFVGGDSRHIRMAVGDSIESFSVTETRSLEFSSAPARAEREPLRPAERVERVNSSAPAVSASGEIPAGTEVVVSMIDDVDSDVARVGQTFRASIDEPVVADGRTFIERGADVVVKLVEDQQAGKLTGKTELTLALVSVTVDGKTVNVTSEEVVAASESRSKKTAKVVGGTAALGAIIGAIAGGGKGAAIGATTGAAAGGAVQVLTKGERVKIPSESRLTFRLKYPARV